MEEEKIFSVIDTNMCKGIAILLMLFHHLFSLPSYYEGFTLSFVPFSNYIIEQIALCAKICVPIFVFLTAYGLTIKMKSQSIDNNQNMFIFSLKRHIRLWLDYSIIYTIFLLFAIIFNKQNIFEIYGTQKIMVVNLLIDFFGLSKLFGTPTLNETWWYIPFAYLLIYIIPIIISCYKKYGDSLFVCIIGILPFFNLDSNSYLYLYLPTALLGVSVAYHNYLDKIKEFCNEFKNCILIFFINLFLLIISLYCRQNLQNLVYILNSVIALEVCIFVCTLVYLPKFLKNILYNLGIYSMNIFLIHTFIKKYYLHDFIYSFNNFLIIFLVLLLISLSCAIIATKLQNRFNTKRLSMQLVVFFEKFI